MILCLQKHERSVYGDPSKGTRKKDEQLIKDAVNDLVKVGRDFRDGKLYDGWG